MTNKFMEIFEAEKQFFDIPESAEDSAKKKFENDYENIYWTSTNRELKHISKMTSNHVSNCINYLYKSGLYTKDEKMYWLTIFRLELIKRDEERKYFESDSKRLRNKISIIKNWYDRRLSEIVQLKQENKILKAALKTTQSELRNRLIERNQKEINTLKELVICLKK